MDASDEVNDLVEYRFQAEFLAKNHLLVESKQNQIVVACCNMGQRQHKG